ncbi:RloB family protein [Nitrincola sp. MINF-07-Sa-05]|uniref:RloB family protein n=1 Tax=Nitrincola salilacus TaxID=3400273 RepID=UPI0039180DD6
MSKRKVPTDRNAKRSKATKDPKPEIVAVCEGANTEPNYLASFASHHGNNLVRVTCIPGAGTPMTIVDKAVAIKDNLIRKARRQKNSFDSSFQVWAVFDIDEHPNIERAVNKAKGNGISVARSNPNIAA